MPNAPHVHTAEEVVSHIKSIEHNASGPGAPSGKRSGPPMPPAGGSVKNEVHGAHNGVPPAGKGKDWVGNSNVG